MAKLTRGARKRRGLSAGGSEQGAHYRRGYKGMPGKPRKARLVADGDPQGMVALKADFLEWLRVRHCSATTLRSYEMQIEHFAVWCAERGVSRPAEVTLAILERYQRWLYHYRSEAGAALALRSQQSKLTCVRAFFRYLVRAHRVGSNPAADLVLPRREVRLPRDVLSAAEAEAVLAVPRLDDTLGLRDRTILELFYSTGIRRAELAGLALYDVDRERSMIAVREGKGRKDRVVPVGERALHWIERYLREVRPQLAVEPDPQTLFLNLCGEPLAPDTLSVLVRRYVAQSGVQKRGSCHLFRHTMATLMLEGGADVRFIQEMLGHASLETTQIYTRVSPRKLQQIHAASHPGAKLHRGEDGAEGSASTREQVDDDDGSSEGGEGSPAG